MRMHQHEEQMRSCGFTLIAGVDEAGRGPLAGPVVAAACIIPRCFFLEGLNDSKVLSKEVRARLYKSLSEHPEVRYGVGRVESEEIDRINILQATMKAMQIAVSQLPVTPDCVLVDGKQLPKLSMKTFGIVDGDSVCLAIAAASIIAKEVRDAIMRLCHEEYPDYGFSANKGYGTAEHLKALRHFGPCPLHRKSFQPVREAYVP